MSAGARGGWSWGVFPQVPSIMEGLSTQPTVQEAFTLGVGKAHRQVVHAGYDFRNVNRGKR